MKNKTKLIAAFILLILISVLSLIWPGAKPEAKAGGLDASSAQKGGRDARSHSGRSVASDADSGAISGRSGGAASETGEERLEKLLKKFSSIAGDDAKTAALLRSLLSEDEQLAHQLMANMSDRELNMPLLKDEFLSFYKDQDRILDALAAFDTVGKNSYFGSYMMKELITLAGEKDLAKTTEWAMANAENPNLSQGLGALGAHYAKTDKPAAMVDEITSSEMDLYNKGAFLTGLLATWSDVDSDAAFSYFADMDQSATLDWTIHRSIETLTKNLDLEEALQWASYITESDMRGLTEREIRYAFKQKAAGNGE